MANSNDNDLSRIACENTGKTILELFVEVSNGGDEHCKIISSNGWLRQNWIWSVELVGNKMNDDLEEFEYDQDQERLGIDREIIPKPK